MKQIELTKESVAHNQEYIKQNIVQDPITELLKANLQSYKLSSKVSERENEDV